MGTIRIMMNPQISKNRYCTIRSMGNKTHKIWLSWPTKNTRIPPPHLLYLKSEEFVLVVSFVSVDVVFFIDRIWLPISFPLLFSPFLSFPFLLLQHPYYPSGIGIGHSRPSTRVSGSLDGQIYFIFEVSSVFSSTQPSLHLGGSNPDWPRKSHLLFSYKITPSHPSFTLAQPSPKRNKYLNQERYFSWVRA